MKSPLQTATLSNTGSGQGVIDDKSQSMNFLLAIVILITTMNTALIFDFDKNTHIQNWRIVDDVVMGGRSSGSFKLSPEGHGLFEGRVSLENNGGFSSVRYGFEKMKVDANSKIVIKLKGDGKPYQLRVKEDSSTRHSYVASFTTTGEWQEIAIPLADMYPAFRGRKLDLPNFPHRQIEKIVFLIGNGKNESFKLLIDKIELN